MNRDDFINQLVDGVTDFSGVDLRGVDFSFLQLVELNFKGANLSGCYLHFTDVISCNFENADLSNAKIHHRNVLYKVNLTSVNLDNARIDFDMCILNEAKIDANTMDKYFPSICPSEGEFIGWKKAATTGNRVIVKLLIPKDARRSSAFGRKCRCDKARVLSIERLYEPGTRDAIAHSFFDKTFNYELGKEVSVDNFDEDRSHECAPGIHFFMTWEEAANYFI